MNLRTLKAPALAAALGIVAAVGCTDTTVLPTSSITSANIFNDPSSYQAFLAKLYADLAVTGQKGQYGAADISCNDEGACNYVRLLWEFEELPTDEAIIAWNDGSLSQLNTQLLTPDNGFLYGMYYRIYFQIGMVNEFLRQTTDAALDGRGNVSATLKTQIHQYRAEARFLRALSYWHAIDIFGNVPLVTENDALGATPPKQTSRDTLYAYVVSELNAIKDSLPAFVLATYGRATTAAAHMLLAELYLNQEVYTKTATSAGTSNYPGALTEAAAVIATPGLNLDPSFMHLFQADNNTSSEIIFPVTSDGARTQAYGNTTFLICASIGGSMNSSNYGVGCGWWGIRLKPQADSFFITAADHPAGDTRNSYFYTSGQSLGITEWFTFTQGIAGPKFTNLKSDGTAGSSNQFPDTDFPMFRLGEAYLIYAEAAVRTGTNLGQALTYVNLLRQRAYGNTSGDITAGQLTTGFILAERGRELLWEGHRRTDLIRYDLFTGNGRLWAFKGGDAAGTSTAETYNLFPLPRTELQVNPNLKQNPGY